MGIFDAMFSDLKDPVDPEIIEAYKYAFRNKGKTVKEVFKLMQLDQLWAKFCFKSY